MEGGQGEQGIERLREAAQERGATVLVVAHDARIVPYADKVFYLEDGRLQDTEEITSRARKAAPARKSSPIPR